MNTIHYLGPAERACPAKGTIEIVAVSPIGLRLSTLLFLRPRGRDDSFSSDLHQGASLLAAGERDATADDVSGLSLISIRVGSMGSMELLEIDDEGVPLEAFVLNEFMSSVLGGTCAAPGISVRFSFRTRDEAERRVRLVVLVVEPVGSKCWDALFPSAIVSSTTPSTKTGRGEDGSR